jgi:hypothetical protein
MLEQKSAEEILPRFFIFSAEKIPLSTGEGRSRNFLLKENLG